MESVLWSGLYRELQQVAHSSVIWYILNRTMLSKYPSRNKFNSAILIIRYSIFGGQVCSFSICVQRKRYIDLGSRNKLQQMNVYSMNDEREILKHEKNKNTSINATKLGKNLHLQIYSFHSLRQ